MLLRISGFFLNKRFDKLGDKIDDLKNWVIIKWRVILVRPLNLELFFFEICVLIFFFVFDLELNRDRE